MAKQTFNSVRFLASEVLLKRNARSALRSISPNAYVQMYQAATNGAVDLTPEQAETARATSRNWICRLGLWLYWLGYDAGRKTGNIPSARSAESNPWL